MVIRKATSRFRRDFEKLTAAQQAAFAEAAAQFLEGLRAGEMPPGVRLHKLRHTHLWSLTWAEDGRATFEFRRIDRTGETHIVWRRIGGHEIYR